MMNNSDFFNNLKNADDSTKEALIKAITKNKLHLKLLVVIINPDNSQKLTNVFNQNGVQLIFKFQASGTADSEILDYLGLGTSHKVVSLCILPDHKCPDLIKTLTREFKLKAPGNGIVFTLPTTGACLSFFKILHTDLTPFIENQSESEVKKMKCESSHEIIISVVNPGYSEDLMSAAKTAGATGGTVFHARQISNDVAKVLGITLQGEREIVAIITKKEKRIDIMKAISSKFGISSEARGLVLSIPVSDIAGIDEYDD